MITQARHHHSDSIPKELRLEYGLSKPYAIAERAASFACLLAGGALGVLFGTVLASSMGFTGDTYLNRVATTTDTASGSAQSAIGSSQSLAQPAPQQVFSPAAPAAQPVAGTVAPVAVSDLEAAPAARHEMAPAKRLARVSVPAPTPAVQAASQGLNKMDGDLPSVAIAIYRIEGDATVVDYDADAGTIEVRDGRTFLLAGVGSQTEAAQWQDYVGNVHYSCDQGGNCTLSRSGTIVPSVKLVSS